MNKNDIPYLDLLCNSFRLQENKIKSKKDDDIKTETNDNEKIIKLIQNRLKHGDEKFGHGFFIDKIDENEIEAKELEKIIDTLIYLAVNILKIRQKRSNDHKNKKIPQKVKDDMDIEYQYLKKNK